MCEDGDVSQRKLPPKERAFRTPADPEFPVCVCARARAHAPVSVLPSVRVRESVCQRVYLCAGVCVGVRAGLYVCLCTHVCISVHVCVSL